MTYFLAKTPIVNLLSSYFRLTEGDLDGTKNTVRILQWSEIPVISGVGRGSDAILKVEITV